VKSFLNIEFATLRGYRPLRLDLHVPEASAPAAVVLFIHGGGFNGGTKDGGPAMDALAKGIAVASVEHRLSSEVKMPAPVHDAKGAVRWLRAHAEELSDRPNAHCSLGVVFGRPPRRAAGDDRRRSRTRR
jgi:acetyl esterase/lipase